MSRIKAVLFDLGGTLVHVESVPETFHKILKAHGVECSIAEISEAWEKANKQLGEKKMADFGARFWINFNLLVLEDLGIKENVLFLAEAIDKEWWEYANFSLYPEALTVLAKLKEMGLKVGVITNGLQTDVNKILAKLGLEGFFDVKVCIDTVGKAKPANEIFTYACEKLGLQPKDVLFVGDSIEIDYEGARKAGLKALLIDRNGKQKRNIRKIKSLQEILSLI
ncbi:MAG: HAD family hydrolase [Candidatus Bathyarchaeales archaeon]